MGQRPNRPLIPPTDIIAKRKCPLLIELASAPYGMNMQKAVQLGLQVCVESGLPGRYAPQDAGEALFDAMISAMTKREGTRDA